MTTDIILYIYIICIRAAVNDLRKTMTGSETTWQWRAFLLCVVSQYDGDTTVTVRYTICHTWLGKTLFLRGTRRRQNPKTVSIRIRTEHTVYTRYLCIYIYIFLTGVIFFAFRASILRSDSFSSFRIFRGKNYSILLLDRIAASGVYVQRNIL